MEPVERPEDRRDLGAREAVEDRLPVAPRLQQAEVAHPRQVLRQDGWRQADQRSQWPDRFLAVQEMAQRAQSLRVRQGGEQARGVLGFGLKLQNCVIFDIAFFRSCLAARSDLRSQKTTMTDTTTPLALPGLNRSAPDFSAKTTDGPRSLADYKGRWLVLFSHSAAGRRTTGGADPGARYTSRLRAGGIRVVPRLAGA
jgi:hypothetical protein